MTVVIDTSVLIDVLPGEPAAAVALREARRYGSLHASEVTRLEVLAGMRPREENTRALCRPDVPPIHWDMVSAALRNQAELLSRSELVELRDAIQAKLDEEVPTTQWAILERRIAEADANPDDFITLNEWEAHRRVNRAT